MGAEVAAAEYVEEKSDALALTPMQLINIAVNKGIGPAELGQLLDLQMRWEAKEARKSYIEAVQKFKKNAPVILRTKNVEYKEVKYSHAELDKMCEILIPELAKYDLSHNWRVAAGEAGRIRVACVLTHVQGHSEDVATIEGPPDTTGSKNAVQAIGSTVYYLERYTLLAGLGLTPKGQDNDGRTGVGLTGEAVDAFINAIRDAHTVDDLRRAYEEAKGAANKVNDTQSVKEFVGAKDKRYRELVQR